MKAVIQNTQTLNKILDQYLCLPKSLSNIICYYFNDFQQINVRISTRKDPCDNEDENNLIRYRFCCRSCKLYHENEYMRYPHKNMWYLPILLLKCTNPTKSNSREHFCTNCSTVLQANIQFDKMTANKTYSMIGNINYNNLYNGNSQRFWLEYCKVCGFSQPIETRFIENMFRSIKTTNVTGQNFFDK